MGIIVSKVKSPKKMESVFKIREEVFVHEQQVDPTEEYDEFETSSTHFLAKLNGSIAGTARWRVTEKGIKLERFAVIKPLRRLGVGQALVKAVLEDIAANKELIDKIIYLHAQLPAVSLYQKFGFKKEGEIFMECGIAHYTMKRYQ